MMQPKPAHLGPAYAAQFSDLSVVQAYANRPPYPGETYVILERLMPQGSRHALELGCGTGDLTLTLATMVSELDALDMSAPMLAAARSRSGAVREGLRWHLAAAETWAEPGPYDIICAGASLHWMDWSQLFPRMPSLLTEKGFLALVDRQVLEQPWDKAVRALIPTYSTNQDFEPYDLVDELTQRGYFLEHGRQTTQPISFEQSLEAYIESFHSSNGFSRERMTAEAAAEFDTAVRAVVTPHLSDGSVNAQVVGRVIWGRPQARSGKPP